MKNFISLLCVFYFLLQFNNLSYSQDDRWVYISSSDQEIVYIDKTTIRCMEKDFLVWVKFVCTSDCSYNYEIQKIRFSVDWVRSYTLSRTLYLDNGNYKTLKVSDEWDDIIPDSMGETIFDYLCKWYSCK